jgi:hypothetical protein
MNDIWTLWMAMVLVMAPATSGSGAFKAEAKL